MTRTVSRPGGHAPMIWLWLILTVSALTGNAIAGNPHVTTNPSGINNYGVIVGTYSSVIHPEANSFVDTKYTHFMNFADPMAMGMTDASGINDQGAVVGTYYVGSHVHGFLYAGGSFETIDYPSASDTRLAGINNAGDITGFEYQTGGVSSFEYVNGAFFIIADPEAISNGTEVAGINNTGSIAGSSNISGVEEGFVLSSGVFTHLVVPGSIYTSAGGINDLGSVVGNFIATPQGPSQGYLYSGGKYTTIDFPGAAQTFLGGINNSGAITGFAFGVQTGRKTTDAGFVYQNGVFTVISDLGHSNPIPEPATWTLMIAGLGGLGAALRRSRRVRRRAA